MDQRQERELTSRAVSYVSSGSTELALTEVRHSVCDYYDQGSFDREQERIFRSLPLIAGHASQLPRTGDYVTETVCGLPVLLCRTPAGAINAFLNVCRHRGARLVAEPSGGGQKQFVCPYHAWAYDIEGRLCNVPDQPVCFPNLDRKQHGLVKLPCEVRHGFVWVGLAPGDQQLTQLEHHLDRLDGELASYGLDQYVVYRQESQPLACNWKLGIEGFLENYHFAFLHRNSTSRLFVHNVAVVDPLGRHIRAVAPKSSIRQLQNGSSGHLRSHATLLYLIFPNACLFIEKNHVSLLQVLPIDAEHSEARITHVVRHDSLLMRRYWEENIRIFMSAVVEDLATCEAIQSGLKSGANQHLLFGRNEVGCIRFREAINDLVAIGTAT